MRWKRYGIQVEITGITRKRTAEILGELLDAEYEYDFATESYTIIDDRKRKWIVGKAENIQAEKFLNNRRVGANYLFQTEIITPLFYKTEFELLSKAMERLELGGGLVNDTAQMSVVLEEIGIENRQRYVSNMENAYKSRGELLSKALNTRLEKIADISELDKDGIVSFPIFKSSFDKNKILSCVQLSQAINSYAETNKSVSAKENNAPNEKFLMRTWLVRVGMVGEEYKFARKMFMENLVGNSAWLKKCDAVEVDEIEQATKINEESEIQNNNEITM